MAIKHAFNSTKPDSSDPTLINASNWNANHVLETPTGIGTSGSGVLVATDNGSGISDIAGVKSTRALQFLRRNTYNNAYEFNNANSVDVPDYVWTPQINQTGAALNVGSNTITLTPVPLGVNAGDLFIRLWISNGTGVAESVSLTAGGTAISGAPTGTIVVTCANTHSGAWTIESASAGIYEAIAANPHGAVHLPLGTYNMKDYLYLNPLKSLCLYGDGYDVSGAFGTKIDFGAVTATGVAAINITPAPGDGSVYPIIFKGFLVVGNGLTTPAIDGFYFTNMTRITLENCMISGFANNGINMTDSFEITIRTCLIQLCGHWGCQMNGTSNLNKLEYNFFSFNSRSNGFGNVAIIGNAGASASGLVYIMNNAIEGAGLFPFTTVTVAFGFYASNIFSLTFVSNYLESNVGGSPDTQVIYAGGILGLVETGNFISSAGTSAIYGFYYDATTRNIISQGNTFYGPGAVRNILSGDWTTYVFGPDTAAASSTEATRSIGLLGTTGAGTALLGTNSPAVTVAHPFIWLKTKGPDGSDLFIPAWK